MEALAEKELERNPIEFIRRESINVEGNDLFYSFSENLEDEEEQLQEESEEDLENEYHESETAVEKRFT